MNVSDASCSGVILAGGLSTRYAGVNKAFIEIGGRRIMDAVYDVFADIFEEILIISNRPDDYLEWDALIAADIFPVRSSLTGIHAGLFYAKNPFVFVTACDTPFIRKEVIQTVLDRVDSDVSVVIPKTAKGMEPLCAVYSKTMLPVMERHLCQKKFKIQMMFNKLKVKTVSESMLRKADPDLISFFNINAPEDSDSARNMINQNKDLKNGY
jgi:molybdenum cofactor guanylyltransferase